MSEQKDEANEKKKPLTQEEAITRKNLLSKDNGKTYSLSYDLTLTIRRSTDKLETDPFDFEGYLQCKLFYYNEKNLPEDNNSLLFMNFVGSIKHLKINEKTINDFTYKDHRIFLPLNELKKDSENSIEILFKGKYNHNGVGLHHYIDPSDKKEYLYTQMEPYDCNRLFPCFDQPDLKATFSLKVIAPKEWIVLSNSFEKEIYDFNKDKLNTLLNNNKEIYDHLFTDHNIENKNYHVYLFEITPKISTYLYALCAGPYYCIKNEKFESPVPLRLFMRESLKDFGEPDEIFKTVIAGMHFYSEYFGTPFQFGKYDQIFCPEYNMGAMENVGLITLNEVYCWKNPPTHRRRTIFAITILHELAHMWFGDYVTMTWWDDLWLNESFATFISHLCMAKSEELNKKYTISWELFGEWKGSAYSADQLETTHPVYSEVKNTEVAETDFDVIVYEKGSSIVKQLYYYIGDENFKKGLKKYFEFFGWSNTKFYDFLDKMEEACEGKKQLKNICDNWLKKAGLTEVSYDIETDENNNIKSFKVYQNACLEKFNNLQTLYVDFLFIYDFEDNNKNKVYTNNLIKPENVTEFTELNGGIKVNTLPAPKFIFLNYNDYGYMKLSLNKKTIKGLNGIEKFKENIVKQSIYRALFDATRDCKISAIEYLNLSFSFLKKENKDNIMILLRHTNSVINQYIPLKYLNEYKKKFYDVMIEIYNNEIEKFNCEEEIIKQLFFFIPSNVTNDEDRKFLVSLLNLDSSMISQENRFSFLKNIFKSKTIDIEIKNKLLEKELIRDKNSDESLRAKLACNALLPDKENKKRIFEEIVKNPTKDSLKNRSELMENFATFDQLDLVSDFITKDYFDVIPDLCKNVEVFYIETFVNYCGPGLLVNDENIKKYEELAEKVKDNHQTYRYVMEEFDLMKRRLRAQKVCEEELNKK